MEDFESRLKGLRLRQPSPELDQRILAAKTQAVPANGRRRVRQMPLWAAAAASLLLGLFGFAAGFAVRGSPPVILSSQNPPASVQVIYHAPSTGDPFDFTRNPDAIVPRQVKTTLQIMKGT
jgi:hypothetical protein